MIYIRLHCTGTAGTLILLSEDAFSQGKPYGPLSYGPPFQPYLVAVLKGF